MPARFEVIDTRRAGKERFRIRLVARNGKIVQVGEGYSRHFDALRAITMIRTTVAEAAVVDVVESGVA